MKKQSNKLYLIIILLLIIVIFLITPNSNKREKIKTYNNIFCLDETKQDNFVFIGDSLTKNFLIQGMIYLLEIS